MRKGVRKREESYEKRERERKKERKRLKEGGNSPGVREKQLWAIDPKNERDARKKEMASGRRRAKKG